MPVSRIYQSGLLVSGSHLFLHERAAHHLAHVLRIKTGDPVILFNGEGGEYQALVTQVNKKGVEVKVGDFVSREVESLLRIGLAQGIARGEKMDWIIQKAVELGVSQIMPLTTERSNVRLTGEREAKRHLHWESVAVSACEQCGRNRLPSIASPSELMDWLPTAAADYRFVLSPYVNDKLPVQMPADASIILLVGPEGGLSDAEAAKAMAAGFTPLGLGPRVLRTETAAIAAIAALQSRYGDLR